MAKDPAFLFYSNDFISGTYTMSDEQVGKYIRLLCLQHQLGRLTQKHMLNICKTYDEDVFAKFIKEGDYYYNERLRIEAEKRKNYCNSRKLNREEKKEKINICKTYDEHMENVNEDENESISKKIIGGKIEKLFNSIPPTFEMVQERIKQRSLKIDAEKFIAYYESNGWKVGKNPMKNWDSCLTTWSKSNYSTNIKNGTTTNGTSGEEQTLRVTKI